MSNKKAKQFNDILAKNSVDCNKTEFEPLLELADKITNSANNSYNSPDPQFKEQLRQRVLGEQRKKEPMKKKINLFSPKIFLRPVLAFASLVLIVGGVALITYLLPGGSKVPVVQAGADFVSVSAPIKFSFPHRFAKADSIKNNLTITPQVKGMEVEFKDKNVIVKHSKNLLYNTKYRAVIKKGADIGFGKKLNDDYVLNFQTRPRATDYSWYRTMTFSKSQDRAILVQPLNYYDDKHGIEVMIDGHSLYERDYQFTVYGSSKDLLFKAYKESSSTSTLDYTKYIVGDKIDSQKVYLKAWDSRDAKKTYYSPKIEKTGAYVVKVQGLHTQTFEIDESSTNYFFVTLNKYVTQVGRLGHDMNIQVVDAKTTKGVKGFDIKAMGGKKNNVLSSGKTDSKGIAKLVVDQKDESDKKPSVILAEKGEEFTAVFLDRGSYSIYNNDSDWNFWQKGNPIYDYTGYVYTERPIYKPGDDVNFKVVTRKYTDGAYKAASTKVRVKVQRDTWLPNPLTIYDKELETNSWGSIAGKVKLSSELKPGDYKIVVKSGDKQIASSQFTVEFFKKPDFEITIKTDKESYITGDIPKVTVSAKYYFGQPLSNQKVNLVLESVWGEKQNNQTLTLDKNGKSKTIEYPNLSGSNYGYYIKATVTDDAGKATTQKKFIKVLDNEFDIKLSDDFHETIKKTGEKNDYRILVKDSVTGKPKTGAKFNVQITTNEAYGDPKGEYIKVVDKDLTTDSLGHIDFNAKVEKPAQYSIDVFAKDKNKNVVSDKFYFTVIEGDPRKRYEQEKRYEPEIIITTDKKSYKIGEKAVESMQLPRRSGQLV